VVKRRVSHEVSFFHPPKCVNFSLFGNSWMSGSILQVINAIFGATQDEVVCASTHITQDEVFGTSSCDEEVEEQVVEQKMEENTPMFNPVDEMNGFPSWDSFLRGFKSAPMYVQRIEDFMRWKSSFGEDISLEAKLIRYFDYKNSELNEEGDRRYSATTLRSWFSIFFAFWKHTGKGDLKMQCPIIDDNIKKWGKTQVSEFIV
jgi:hypothetical protein